MIMSDNTQIKTKEIEWQNIAYYIAKKILGWKWELKIVGGGTGKKQQYKGGNQ